VNTEEDRVLAEDTTTAAAPADQAAGGAGAQPGGEAGGPTRYLSIAEFADRVGVAKNSLYNMRGDPARMVFLPDPDVLIGGEFAGWTEARVVAWGIDVGRLNPDGTIRKGGGGRPSKEQQRERRKLLPRWRTKVTEYVGATQATELLGLENVQALYLLRARGTFIEPAVVVGDILGWRKQDVIQFGMRTGRLGPGGAPTPRRRGGPRRAG
jgi:predicted DNA-binding transcriptional regulator AlpA